MGAYNIVNPAHLVAGQLEDVGDVLANLQAIQTILNGHIDNTNIDPAAAIAYTKLALGNSIVNADIAAAAAIQRTKLLRSFTKVYNSAVQAIPANLGTYVTFDSESSDDEGLHSVVANTTRITFPADGGFWLVGARLSMADPTGTNQIEGRVILNNAVEIANAIGPRDAEFGATHVTMCVARVMAAGDFIELNVTQNTAGNLNTIAGADATNLWALRL